MLVYRNLDMLSMSQASFNISFSISAFEILLNLKYLFVLLLFITTILGWFLYCSIDHAIGSSVWLIFTDLSWYFRIFRFGTTVIKKLLRTSATLSFLSKIKSCSANAILLWVEPFSEKTGLIDFQKVLLSVTFSWSTMVIAPEPRARWQISKRIRKKWYRHPELPLRYPLEPTV